MGVKRLNPYQSARPCRFCGVPLEQKSNFLPRYMDAPSSKVRRDRIRLISIGRYRHHLRVVSVYKKPPLGGCFILDIRLGARAQQPHFPLVAREYQRRD